LLNIVMILVPFIPKTITAKAKSHLLEQAQSDLAKQFRKCILVDLH